jgi:hypothetical protein
LQIHSVVGGFDRITYLFLSEFMSKCVYFTAGLAASMLLTPTAYAQTGNVGINTASPTQTLDVNGTVQVGTSGAPAVIYSPTTGTHNLLAVAYGQLGGGGSTIFGSSGNYTLARVGTGSYTLTFPAASGLSGYNFTNAVVMVSLYGPAAVPGMVTWVGGPGSITVNTFSYNGIPTDRIFTVTVFQP